MTDVMISYSRKDVEFVKKIHGVLVSQQRDIWVDWEDIPKTAEWWQEIKDGIESANNFLYIISPDSVASEVCGWEINHAIELKKRLIPVMHRDVTDPELKNRMNPALNSHNWIFARETDDFEQVMQQIAQAMDTDLDHVHAHTRLLVRAREWDKNGRLPAALLRGSELNAARSWLTEAVNKKPTAENLQIQYITESQRAAAARTRTLIGGIAFTTIIALMAFIAVWQAIRAENARHTAVLAQEETQRLALASNAIVSFENDDLDLGLALALEANREMVSPATMRALSSVAYAPGTRQRITTGAPVTGIALSPDGTMALAGENNGTIILYDPATGTEIRRLEKHTGPVNSLVFSEDGKTALSGSSDNTLGLWDIATGKALKTFEGHTAEVNQVALSSDGTFALSASNDGTIRKWDLETGTSTVFYNYEGNPAGEIVISTDGMIAVSASTGGEVVVQQTADAEVVTTFHMDGTITALALDSSRNQLYFALSDASDTSHNIYRYALDSQSAPVEISKTSNAHTKEIHTMAITPSGTQMVTGSADNHVILWSLSDDDIKIDSLNGHLDSVNAVGISADGKYLLSGSADQTLRYWDTFNGAQVNRYQLSDRPVWNVDFTPDGQYLFVTSLMGLIDITTGKTIRTFSDPEESQGWTVDFSPDGKTVVCAMDDGSVVVWNVETAEEIYRQYDKNNPAGNAVFTRDGKELLVGYSDGSIGLWDLNPEREARIFQGVQTSTIWAVAVSQDGKFFASASADGTAVIWDLTGSGKSTLLDYKILLGADLEHTPDIWDVAISPDSRYVALASADARITLWDAASGQPVMSYDGHRSQVSGVTFSKDGQYLISGGYDNKVMVWDVASGELVHDFVGHTTPVADVTISPDGRMVVSGSLTGSVRLWYVHSADELLTWAKANRYIRDLTCFEKITYDIAADCSVAGTGIN